MLYFHQKQILFRIVKKNLAFVRSTLINFMCHENIGYNVRPHRSHHFFYTGGYRQERLKQRQHAADVWITVHWDPNQWLASLLLWQPLALHILGAGWYHTKRHSCSLCALSVLLRAWMCVCVCGFVCGCVLHWVRASSHSLCSETERPQPQSACLTGTVIRPFTLLVVVCVCVYVCGYFWLHAVNRDMQIWCNISM